MNCKRLLRFYFRADALNAALDRIILKTAISSGSGIDNAFGCADRIISLIGAKSDLNELWVTLDGALSGFCEREQKVLEFYAESRKGISCLTDLERREIKRVLMKFSRRIRRCPLKGGEKIVDAYYALI